MLYISFCSILCIFPSQHISVWISPISSTEQCVFLLYIYFQYFRYSFYSNHTCSTLLLQVFSLFFFQMYSILKVCISRQKETSPNSKVPASLSFHFCAPVGLGKRLYIQTGILLMSLSYLLVFSYSCHTWSVFSFLTNFSQYDSSPAYLLSLNISLPPNTHL